MHLQTTNVGVQSPFVYSHAVSIQFLLSPRNYVSLTFCPMALQFSVNARLFVSFYVFYSYYIPFFSPARIDLPTNGGRYTNVLIHNSDTPHLTWASNERREIEIESLKENVAMVQNSKTHEWKERGKLGREDDNTWIRFNGLQMTWLQNLSLQGHEQHVDEHGGSESTVSIYLIKKQKLPDHNQV